MDTSFEWNSQKNHQLIEERGVSFDEVAMAIYSGHLVDTVDHPNQTRYPGQRIYVVEVNGYLHLVPFVTQSDGTRFLKTIIPSRKANRDYLRRRS